MAQTYSFGLKTFAIGAIAANGGAGTVLTSPGDIRQNTLKVTSQAPTRNDFFAEGKDTPVISTYKLSSQELELDLMALDPAVIADLTGGTVTGVAPNQTYNAPSNVVVVEKTVKIVDTQNNTWLFPRVQITAMLMGNFTNTEINIVRVKGVILQPTLAGTAPFTYTQST